jgi:hypothetical protein
MVIAGDPSVESMNCLPYTSNSPIISLNPVSIDRLQQRVLCFNYNTMPALPKWMNDAMEGLLKSQFRSVVVTHIEKHFSSTRKIQEHLFRWMLDGRCWMLTLDAGCWMVDARWSSSAIDHPTYSIQYPETSSIQYPETSSIQHPETSSIQHPEPSITQS